MNIVWLLVQLLTRGGVVLICRLLPVSTAFLSYKLRLLRLSSFDVLDAQKFLQDLPSIGMVRVVCCRSYTACSGLLLNILYCHML